MRKRYYNLDIIKIIAAIIVVFHHYQQISGVRFQTINFFGGNFAWGYLVELFFLISGFLVITTDTKEKKFVSAFWHKCVRIYPMAIISVLFLLGITYIYQGCFEELIFNEAYGVWNIVTSILLIHQGWAIEVLPAINNPTWYLCVLLWCYIIFYFIKFINQKLHINSVYFFLGIVILGCVAMKLKLTGPFLYATTCRGYVGFFVGCFWGIIAQKYFSKLSFIRRSGLFLSICFVLTKGVSNWYGLVLLIFPTILIYAVSMKQVSHKYISFLSAVSYEVYLWHVPIYAMLKMLFKLCDIKLLHTEYTMIIFLLIVEIFSCGIYKYIEIPLNKKGGYFNNI